MSPELNINTWRKFTRYIRPEKNNGLMSELSNFPGSILVGGCQRSGTTMVSEAIMKSDDIADISGTDKELVGALILAGYIQVPNEYRYCFQTTYLNDCYHEYWNYNANNKLIWMIRNPQSVVYSLTRFSERFCLDGLFMSCGRLYMNDEDKNKFMTYGSWSINRLRKACYCYNAKVDQIFTIFDQLGSNKVLIVDYDELVVNKNRTLASIFRFADISYKLEYSDFIHNKSISKALEFSDKKRDLINNLCGNNYNLIKEALSKM